MASLCTSRSLALIVLFALFCPPSTAVSYGEPTPSNYCFYACHDAVGYITFNVSTDAALDDYYTAYCTNTLQIQSAYYCAQTYCSKSQIRSGYNLLNGQCIIHAGVTYPRYEAVSSEDLAKIPVVNLTVETTSVDTPLPYPVIPDAEWQDQSFKTVSSFYKSWWISYDFSWSIYGFWGLVLLIGISHRLLELFRFNSARKYTRTSSNSSAWLWIRRRLILPATFGRHCQDPIGWCTIPPRLESLLICLYILLNVVYLFPDYDLFSGDTWYPEERLQLARYLSDRSGILSIAQLPLVWVFASRNDPFLWLTGWSFATYNNFHRWTARMATLHAVIHSIGWSVYEAYEGGYASQWTAQYWYCGAIATVAMTFLLGASVYQMRQKFYDLFLILHIGLAVIFLVTLWFHVKIFDGEFNGFIWPCVAIWSLDRLLRIGRILWFGLIPRLMKGVKATATFNQDSDMIRLDITDFFPSKDIMPGTFYYVYTPGAVRGYESHPFTLCSWRRRIPASPSEASRSMSLEEKSVVPEIRPVDDQAQVGEVNHCFLIRPYGGFTRRLKTHITAPYESVGSCQVTVFLEGPYGNELDLSNYSDVLIIAGGSGITAAISHSHFLLPRGSTRVTIVWAVPQRHLVDDVCSHELASVMGHERLDLAVYLTSAVEEVTSPERISPKKPYEVRFGRPDVEALMRQARELCDRNLAVITCGTPQMADTCRAACVRLLAEQGPQMGYFNETMLW